MGNFQYSRLIIFYYFGLSDEKNGCDRQHTKHNLTNQTSSTTTHNKSNNNSNNNERYMPKTPAQKEKDRVGAQKRRQKERDKQKQEKEKREAQLSTQCFL
jgi:hypothetical protein